MSGFWIRAGYWAGTGEDEQSKARGERNLYGLILITSSFYNNDHIEGETEAEIRDSLRSDCSSPVLVHVPNLHINI